MTVPRGDVAQKFLRSRGQLGRERQTEIAVHALHEPQQPLDFLADLVLGHEAMGVVLRKLADAREA